MIYTEGPAGLYERGIEYHNSDEITKDGVAVERYVLSKPLTPEQEQDLGQYENIRLSKGGCKYKYDPNIKYDVLYITTQNEGGEEAAEEDLDEAEILNQLDTEIESDGQSFMEISTASAGISLVNSLLLYAKEAQVNFPENAEVFEKIAQDCANHLGLLQSIINKDPSIGEGFNQGLGGNNNEM